MRVYHVVLESKTEEIQQVGIRLTDAPECRCGIGVHICEKKLTAEIWADWRGCWSQLPQVKNTGLRVGRGSLSTDWFTDKPYHHSGLMERTCE